MEALLHKQYVLLLINAMGICNGQDHFFIHDIVCVKGTQVANILEKWISQFTKGATRFLASFLNVTYSLWDFSLWEVKD